MYILKEQIKKENRLTSGHRMCAGCGAPVIVNGVLRALKEEDNAAISVAKIVHLFTQHLNVHLLLYLVLKLCIINSKKMEK